MLLFFFLVVEVAGKLLGAQEIYECFRVGFLDRLYDFTGIGSCYHGIDHVLLAVTERPLSVDYCGAVTAQFVNGLAHFLGLGCYDEQRRLLELKIKSADNDR